MTATTAPTTDRSCPGGSRGDTNAFFGLGFNVLVNVLMLTGLCLVVVNIPGADVFGSILPALGIALLIGNVYYTYLARRLARRENRTDVTRDAVRAERAAHVHRRLRDHAADLPGDQGPDRGLGRPGSPGRSSSASSC